MNNLAKLVKFVNRWESENRRKIESYKEVVTMGKSFGFSFEEAMEQLTLASLNTFHFSQNDLNLIEEHIKEVYAHHE